jgi:hypothetical protein
VRCYWCNTIREVKEIRPGVFRCVDGAACAERHGEMMWAAYPGMPLPAPGRYCCLDPACTHPKEQVFNGGGG